MNILFISYIIFCTVLAYLLLKVIVVKPYKKRADLQEARTSLSRCINRLNDDVLLNGKIKNGEYLHDTFYKFILSFYLCDTPKIKISAKIPQDELIEKERVNFRNEINKLDADTRLIINETLFSISRILLIKNPIAFPLLMLKTNFALSKLKNKEEMVKNVEYIAIRRENDIVSFNGACHA